MKKQLLFIALSLLVSSNLFPNDSWTRIYQSGTWHIQSFYKIHNPGSSNSIYIQHNSEYTLPDIDNGAVKKYSPVNNSWTDPANGFLNSKCATCVDPPYIYTWCAPVPFFMISAADNDFMLNFQITPCASCPDASTFVTYTGGMSSQNYYGLFGCGGSIFYPYGGDINPDNDSVCYYGFVSQNYFTAGIFKSVNRGANWTQLIAIPDLRHTGPSNWDNMSGGFIKINPFNTEYIFTVHRDYMMLSTDGGYNFASINIPPLKELAFDYTDNIIYGVTQRKIYKSNDNGLTWSMSDVPFHLNTMEVSPDNNNIIYAGSETGLYRSTNQGISWYAYNNSFSPSKNVIGLSKDLNSGDTIIVSTEDAVYKVFRDFLTGFGNANNLIPEEYRLEQNYPNPFNPSTTIKFQLMKPGITTLKIYDGLGREVTSLVNNALQAGSYEIEFNASQYPSGIYYYKITSGEFSQTKKMILAK